MLADPTFQPSSHRSCCAWSQALRASRPPETCSASEDRTQQQLHEKATSLSKDEQVRRQLPCLSSWCRRLLNCLNKFSAARQLQISSAKTSLRSSWLYRQRVAGRVHRRERQGAMTFVAYASGMLSCIPIIKPDGLMALAWECTCGLGVLYIATMTPLQVCGASI